MEQVNNLPMMNPEIVTAIGFMLLFITFRVEKGYVTMLLAHIAFCIPYVMLSVMPKIRSLDPNLADAAMDLGATPWRALTKVIVPQIMPGIVSGFALAITLSLDDYFIASYTKPATFNTISTYVVNATKGSQTEIKTALWALSTVIFLIVILAVVVMNVAGRKTTSEKGGVRNEK